MLCDFSARRIEHFVIGCSQVVEVRTFESRGDTQGKILERLIKELPRGYNYNILLLDNATR